jgi:hypothetical protein
MDPHDASSVQASPADVWRRTLGSLRAFGCVPNDQNAVGDGRVAYNFLSLLAHGTPEQLVAARAVEEAKKTGNVAKMVFARWSNVFRLITAVFGLSTSEDERAHILSGQGDSIVALLHRLLLQARASQMWEAAVMEAHRRNQITGKDEVWQGFAETVDQRQRQPTDPHIGCEQQVHGAAARRSESIP